MSKIDISVMERARVNALVRGDSAVYSRLCSELGIRESDIERPEMLEQAEADRILRKERAPRMRAFDLDENYKRFLRDAYNCRYRDFGEDYEYKREVLENCFPGRFGKNGKQNLGKYDQVQLGALFRNLVISAEKITGLSKRH